VRRTLAVTFCLGLLVALVMVFTRVIAARIPEQRATLEKLITDRTGLAVRFDNVHFAWDLDGMNAVFSRVELTDPKAGRVRVVAPELRVEFDTWDFLRHQQFSLGHVTLSSPDIEIIGDPEEPAGKVAAPGRATTPPPAADERALMRRYLAWVELMPTGRIEVEGARVHLLRRGQSPAGKAATRHSFMLSQGVISRGNGTFNAHGTLLLTQDVGQSLFVAARLEGLDAGARASGELRLIARRVFLDKLPIAGLGGRGTVDATFRLRDGRVNSGRWQASARELELRDQRRRFDHLSVNGTLARDGQDLVLDFTDLQLTRGAHLERAPNVNLRLALRAGSTRIERSTLRAERMPFMVGELMTAMLPARSAEGLAASANLWQPTAGELRDVSFDSGEPRTSAAWRFSARVAGLEITRPGDGARLEGLAAQVDCDARELTLRFDQDQQGIFRSARIAEPRPLILSGVVALPSGAATPVIRFETFAAVSGSARIGAHGQWSPGIARAAPLELQFMGLDHAVMHEAWVLLAADRPEPELFADIEQLHILQGNLELAAEADGAVNWRRSIGKVAFTGLTTAGGEMPRLTEARGAVTLTRGATRLELESGAFEGLALREARIDWPRRGAPRLNAALDGQLDAPLLREALVAQGLERLSGTVALEAEARGERELRDPGQWRVTARISDARLPLGSELPAVEKLSGTLRYSAGQLRGLALAGNWLGGPVEVESRRAGQGGLAFAVNGVADASPLLRLLGQEAAAQRVSGQFAWSGSAQAGSDGQWKISLASNLGGVESRLPAPFDKPRARAQSTSAELLVARDGVRDFAVDSGRALQVRGQILADVTSAHFDVQGVSGDLRRSAATARESELTLEQLDLARAPQVLATVGALLPAEDVLVVKVDEARHGARSLGALQARITPQASGVAFSLESAGAAIHQIRAQGQCASDSGCRAEFTATTAHLAALLADARLPAEWPARSLHASGELSWPIDAQEDFARSLAGNFEIQTAGADDDHQLSASATLSDGEIVLADLQGTGPEPDLVFRGQGRIGLTARDYDFTVDYERVALAATAVPSPARARLARAWNSLRGSVARRGWTEAPETRRVQWHGTWD
jgi:hypothetical protein